MAKPLRVCKAWFVQLITENWSELSADKLLITGVNELKLF